MQKRKKNEKKKKQNIYSKKSKRLNLFLEKPFGRKKNYFIISREYINYEKTLVHANYSSIFIVYASQC